MNINYNKMKAHVADTILMTLVFAIMIDVDQLRC